MNKPTTDVKGRSDSSIDSTNNSHSFECGCTVSFNGIMKRCPTHALAPEMAEMLIEGVQMRNAEVVAGDVVHWSGWFENIRALLAKLPPGDRRLDGE